MPVKRKKLCIIIPAHWAAKMGGSEYQVKVLIDALQKMDRYEIFYLARYVSPEYIPENYKIIKIAERNWLWRLGFFFDALQLLKILGKIRPDIIYQRVGCAYTGIAAHYSKNNKCNMVWHIAHDRNLLPFEFRLSRDIPVRLLEQKALEYGILNASYIVAQTEWQKEQVAKRYGRTATVIPNFHPMPKEIIKKEDPVKVVWAANFKSWKRPELFIRLAHDMRNVENTEFIMIGQPYPDREKQNILVAKMSELGNLRYLGSCDQDRVNEVLAMSHIFVNTSQYEGFANTFIQAWMRRVPVVSLAVNPDGIFNSNNVGILSGTYEKMLEDVNTLIQDSELRSLIGHEAQEYAFEHHSEKGVEKLAQILDS